MSTGSLGTPFTATRDAAAMFRLRALCRTIRFARPSTPDRVELRLNFRNPPELNVEAPENSRVSLVDDSGTLVQTVHERIELAARDIPPF